MKPSELALLFRFRVQPSDPGSPYLNLTNAAVPFMHVVQCLCTDGVSFLEWTHPLSSSRDFQRGETHENRILERAPGAVTDARPAAAPALSFSPSGARLFLEGHTSPLSLQSYKDIIMQFNLNTQFKLSG